MAMQAYIRIAADDDPNKGIKEKKNITDTTWLVSACQSGLAYPHYRSNRISYILNTKSGCV